MGLGMALGFALVAGGARPISAAEIAAEVAAPVAGSPGAAPAAAQPEAYTATVAYVSQFYPLWFSYNQSRFASHNRLVGPVRVTPLYHIVVAINVDTLYASTFLDLAAQPVVLTIPDTGVTYSILTLDPYGDIFDSGLPKKAGSYVLTGPGFKGTLPADLPRISMPLNDSILIFRADKHSASGQNQEPAAEKFRASIRMQALCDYAKTDCPGGAAHDSSDGSTLILPEIAFAIPYKSIADGMVAHEPIKFLQQLQTAVAAPSTPPMSAEARALSDRFNRLFGDGSTRQAEFAAGAQAAHSLIVDRYLTHTGSTHWINFTNIGDWGKNVVERSAITEFLQYGNGFSTAAYYHTFKDAQGHPLNGSDGQVYVLTFPAGQLPQAQRFWSVTAYAPETIELIGNSANQYDVASYTPGLQTNADGSLSLYFSAEQPPGVPKANWLPVARQPFNLMLRVYGPEGSVANQTYVPPAIARKP
ncbi:MAG TPA: DUF1214 domain-containing protein [Thermoanaerobaculia bacterium]|nr:DUF1214 domain-containing protein [Thermoanaerobaculia bacterium]